MGKLWENNSEIQAEAIAARAVESVASLLAHPTPDVRAAAVFALGALVRVPDAERRDAGADRDGDDHHARENITGFDADERVAAERAVAMAIVPAVSDASPLVRAEAAAALGRVTRAHAAFSNPPRRGRDGTRGRDRRRREANPSAPRDTSDMVRPWDRSPWRR